MSKNDCVGEIERYKIFFKDKYMVEPKYVQDIKDSERIVSGVFREVKEREIKQEGYIFEKNNRFVAIYCTHIYEMNNGKKFHITSNYTVEVVDEGLINNAINISNKMRIDHDRAEILNNLKLK